MKRRALFAAASGRVMLASNMTRSGSAPVVQRRAVNRAALLGLAVTALGGLLRRARASERELVRLGLALHMAREEDGPVAEEAFVVRQVATANRIFAPYGVEFERREHHERDARAARMQTRADRDALAAFVRPHWIKPLAG